MKFPSAIPGPGRGASWRSPGHPPRPGSQSDRENAALRPPRVAGSTCFTAPEQTRVAIGPMKHGTLHGQVACFPGGKAILARKVAFGPRAAAKTRRESRYFRAVNPARGGIRTYIYMYISPNYSRGLLNCRKYNDVRRGSVNTLVRYHDFPSQFTTLSKKRRPMSPK